MASFDYTALTATGTTIRGRLEAHSTVAAVAALQACGHYPLRTVPAAENFFRRFGRRGRSSLGGLAIGTHELASLLEAGLPLDRALDIVIGLTADLKLRAAFKSARERVCDGVSLAEAVEAEGHVFSKVYVSLIRAGEAAGNLDATLRWLADYLTRAQAVRDQIKSALVYPIILLMTAALSLSFILTVVVPQFKPLFADAGKSLPLATSLVMMLGDFAAQWTWVLVLLGIALWLLLRRALAKPLFRLRWDGGLLRLPILGDLIAKMEAARFARTLGTVLKAGVPLPAGLAIARDTLGNIAMAAAAGEAAVSLREGESLGDLLAVRRVFPALAAQLVRVGEETGRLDEMLLHQAGLFERDVQRATERMLAALVPGLTIGLGIVVAGIVASILVAILDINQLAL